MLCKKCGATIKDSSKFCENCGERILEDNTKLIQNVSDLNSNESNIQTLNNENSKNVNLNTNVQQLSKEENNVKKNNKELFIIMGITVLIVVSLLIFFKVDLSEVDNIYTDSKKYDLEDYIAEKNENLANYQLLLYNNERIYFYNKETQSILEDNSEVIKNVEYGQSYCDDGRKSLHGENIKCKDTFDFFELFLHDTGELLVVDKDGYIINIEKEYDYDNEPGKYGFYYTYWYSNVKIYKENTNNEVYIQEIYDSEGSAWLNVIHKDENGKLNKLYKITDFYLVEDKYIELANNKINIFKNGKLIKENNKYDELYDIYDGKYILVKDNNNLKIIDLNDQIIVNFGEYDNLRKAKIVEENGIMYIYKITIDSGHDRLFKFDMLGNFEYLEDLDD